MTDQEKENESVFEPVTCGSGDPLFCSHLLNFKRQLYNSMIYDTEASTQQGQDMSILDDYRSILKRLYEHLMEIYSGKRDSGEFIKEITQTLERIFTKNNQSNTTKPDFGSLVQTTITVVQQDAQQNQTKNNDYIYRVLVNMPFQLSPISEDD